MNGHIKKIQQILADKKLDYALFWSFGSPANPVLTYLAQYSGIGCVLIGKTSAATLIVPDMEYERAHNTGIQRVRVFGRRPFSEVLQSCITKPKRRLRIGIDATKSTVSELKFFRKHIPALFVDMATEISEARMHKNDREIALIKKACAQGDIIFGKCLKNFRKFKTESDVAAYLVYETKRAGLEVSFPPIVASGKHASMPHYEPKNVGLHNGFCVLDFGVISNGYCSDMTRTVFLGRPSAAQKKIYGFMQNIQQQAIEFCKEDMLFWAVHEFAVRALGKYKKYFIHSLGHGIGVAVHEAPSIGPKNPQIPAYKITNGMAFTIEPGIYLPKKYGIRIEDTVVFDKKISVLTKTPKDLITLYR